MSTEESFSFTFVSAFSAADEEFKLHCVLRVIQRFIAKTDFETGDSNFDWKQNFLNVPHSYACIHVSSF